MMFKLVYKHADARYKKRAIIASTAQMLFSAHANFSGPEDYTHEQTRPVVDVI